MIYTHLLYSSEHNRIISIRLTCNWKILLNNIQGFFAFVHQKIVVWFKQTFTCAKRDKEKVFDTSGKSHINYVRRLRSQAAPMNTSRTIYMLNDESQNCVKHNGKCGDNSYS